MRAFFDIALLVIASFGGLVILGWMWIQLSARRAELRWVQYPDFKAGKERGAEWARETRKNEPERVRRVARLNIDASYEEAGAVRVLKVAYPHDPAERAAERLWGRHTDRNLIESDAGCAKALPFIDGFVAGVREVAPPP